MVFDNSTKRALKGFLLSSFMDFRKTYTIGTSISIGIMVLNYIINSLILSGGSQGTINSNAGMLYAGFISMLITFGISVFVSTSSSEIRRKFVFPINRKVFAVGNLVFIIAGSVVLLMILSILQSVELTVGKIVQAVFPYFAFINSITLSNFLLGFWTSLTNMVFAISLVYLVSMFFHRYKIETAVVVGIVSASFLFFPQLRDQGSYLYYFYFRETSIIVLSIKMWISAGLFNLLAFIPLRRMEVME